MSLSAQDPFYYIKDQVDESVSKLSSNYATWQTIPPSPQRDALSTQLLDSCGSIERQVDELNRAISVAEKNPVKFKVGPAEIEQRRRWATDTKSKVSGIRATAQEALQKSQAAAAAAKFAQQGQFPPQHAGPDYSHENDEYIAAESDRQSLLMREQGQDLDDISTSLDRIGDVGVTMNEELTHQVRSE